MLIICSIILVKSLLMMAEILLLVHLLIIIEIVTKSRTSTTILDLFFFLLWIPISTYLGEEVFDVTDLTDSFWLGGMNLVFIHVARPAIITPICIHGHQCQVDWLQECSLLISRPSLGLLL